MNSMRMEVRILFFFFLQFFIDPFLKQMSIRFSERSLCHNSGVDLRDNQETPQGGSWVKQKKQDRSGKNMQRLIEIIQKEKESKGHSERSYNPIEDDHKKNNIRTCWASTSLIKGYEKGSWDDGDEAAMMKCKFERTKKKLQDSYQNLEKGICFFHFSKVKDIFLLRLLTLYISCSDLTYLG